MFWLSLLMHYSEYYIILLSDSMGSAVHLLVEASEFLRGGGEPGVHSGEKNYVHTTSPMSPFAIYLPRGDIAVRPWSVLIVATPHRTLSFNAAGYDTAGSINELPSK